MERTPFHNQQVKVYVTHELTKTEQSILENIGGNTFIFKVNENHAKHSHPIAHYTRALAELLTIRLIANDYKDVKDVSVVDAGGNAMRTGRKCNEWNIGYHGANPMYEASDLLRLNNHQGFKNTHEINLCHSTIQECIHKHEHDALLSIHSLYYIPPHDFMNSIISTKSKVGYAVVHKFSSLTGNFFSGEATYMIRGSVVEMHIRGNQRPYVHDSLAWMEVGSYTDGTHTMVWDEIALIGENYIYKFNIHHGVLPSKTCTLHRPIKGQRVEEGDLRGLRDTQAVNAHTSKTYEFNAGIVTDYGIVLSGETTSLTIPSEIISEGRMFMVGKDRKKKEHWVSLLNYLKSKVGRLNVPHEQQPDVVIFGAAMAFTADVNSELDAMTHTSKSFTDIMKLQLWGTEPIELANEMFDIKFLKHWAALFLLNIYKLVLALWVTHGTRMVYYYLAGSALSNQNGVRDEYVTISYGIWLYMTLLICYCYHVYSLVSRATSTTFGPDTLKTPVDKYSSDPNYVAGLSAKVGKLISTPLDWMTSGKFVKSSKPALHVDGIVPTRCANDTPNQIHGLVRRMLAGQEHSDWTEELNWSKSTIEQLYNGGPCELSIAKFDIWLHTQFGRREDKNRVAQLEKAYVELSEDPGKLKFELSPFIKDEAYVGKGNAPKPRMIFAPNDYYMVATSPLTYAMGVDLKRRWSINHFVYYTSGANAEDLGDWFDSCLNDMPDGVIGEFDGACWEGSVTVEARNSVMDDTDYLSTDPNATVLLRMQNHQRGRTREGLKWEREGGMSSGVGDTSVTNSKINAKMMFGYVNKFADRSKPLRDQFRMLVLGDDNLVWVSRELGNRAFPNLKADGYVAHAAKRGFTIEAKMYKASDPFSLYKAEYCSGWFNKTRDIQGNEFHYWTPKVGRVLSKTFFTKSYESEKNVPGIIKATAESFTKAPVDPLLRGVSEELVYRLRSHRALKARSDRYLITDHNPVLNPTVKRKTSNYEFADDFTYEAFGFRYNLAGEGIRFMVRDVCRDIEESAFPISLSSSKHRILNIVLDLDIPGYFEQVELGDTSNGDTPNPNFTFINSDTSPLGENRDNIEHKEETHRLVEMAERNGLFPSSESPGSGEPIKGGIPEFPIRRGKRIPTSGSEPNDGSSRSEFSVELRKPEQPHLRVPNSTVRQSTHRRHEEGVNADGRDRNKRSDGVGTRGENGVREANGGGGKYRGRITETDEHGRSTEVKQYTTNPKRGFQQVSEPHTADSRHSKTGPGGDHKVDNRTEAPADVTSSKTGSRKAIGSVGTQAERDNGDRVIPTSNDGTKPRRNKFAKTEKLEYHRVRIRRDKQDTGPVGHVRDDSHKNRDDISRPGVTREDFKRERSRNGASPQVTSSEASGVSGRDGVPAKGLVKSGSEDNTSHPLRQTTEARGGHGVDEGPRPA